MENKKQYCILCGAENNMTDKFCHKCGESLNQKDDDLQEYAKEKIKDKVTGDLKDKATNTFLDWLKKFLNSKAYGIILSLSVVAGATSVLAGGVSGVKEFSNNVPGMFKDGTVYAVNLSGMECLETFGGVGIYPVYDTSGDISLIYLAGSTHFSMYTDLKVTGSGGKVLIDERIQEDERGARQFCYVVEDLNASVEIVPKAVDGSDMYDGKAEIVLGTDYGIRKYSEYGKENLEKVVEYHDNGNLKYQYFLSLTIYADEGYVYGDHEIYYDELGRETLNTLVEKGVEVNRTETTYKANGGMTRIIYVDGLIGSEWEEDANGNCLKEVVYLDPGVIGYTDVYTYYDDGTRCTATYYGRGGSPEDGISMYEEYYPDGSKKLYQSFTDEGMLESETIYNQDGTGKSFVYSYDYDPSARYVSREYSFYLDQYGNSVYTKEIHYNSDGSVRTEYDYDENGNRI